MGRGTGGVFTLATVVLGLWLCAAAGADGPSEGRVFEQVSPAFKGGYGANAIQAVAQNGEGVAFTSLGAFAGALGNPVGSGYLARRGASGWSTTSLAVPSSTAPFASNLGPEDYSAEFDSALNLVVLGANRGQAEQEGTEAEFVLHGFDAPYGVAAFTQVPPVLSVPEGGQAANIIYRGGSANFAQLFFTSLDPLLPEATQIAGGQAPYDLNTLTGVLQLVGLDDSGHVIGQSCHSVLGDEATGVETREASQVAAGSVSRNGAVVFFRAKGSACGGQLFARLDGQRTLEVSQPLGEACGEVPCPGAVKRGALGEMKFWGASEDGSRVFFTTPAPLVASDKDNGVDLYMAQLGCPGGETEACATSEWVVTGLTQVSHSPSGEAAVQGVVAVAPDGSRVYLVAHGVLANRPNASGQSAIAGAENLYEVNTDEGEDSTTFIADLCSGGELSGTAADERCPVGAGDDSALWMSFAPEAQLAEDGRVLVFSSVGQLTSDDTDTALDVFRFDLASDALERISGGEDGFDSDGNRDGSNALIEDESRALPTAGNRARLKNRAVSEDGSRMVFTSSEALAPGVREGVENVYEWHDGTVTAITRDGGRRPLITPSGRDIFFVTDAGLVPGDTDGAPDVYDARIGGGFPAPPAERAACSGDACQGPLSAPASTPTVGSALQLAGESLPAPAPQRQKKTAKKARHQRSTHAKKRGNAHKRGTSARRVGRRGR